MWSHRYLFRIDWRLVFVMGALMIISLLVISATDPASRTAMKVVFSLRKSKVNWNDLFWGGASLLSLPVWITTSCENGFGFFIY